MTHQKKVLFFLRVDNVIDIITNSSSELFVLNTETKEIAKALVSKVYPAYLSEYEEIKHISELTIDELDTYIQYHCSPEHDVMKAITEGIDEYEYPLLPGFTFEELYEKKDKKYSSDSEFKLKSNSRYRFVTENNFEEIKQKLGNNLYFLYSIDENPDWDFQDKLSEIAERYHLG